MGDKVTTTKDEYEVNKKCDKLWKELNDGVAKTCQGYPPFYNEIQFINYLHSKSNFKFVLCVINNLDTGLRGMVSPYILFALLVYISRYVPTKYKIITSNIGGLLFIIFTYTRML